MPSFYSADDWIKIRTVVEEKCITSTGNVGINTSAPNTNEHIGTFGFVTNSYCILHLDLTWHI